MMRSLILWLAPLLPVVWLAWIVAAPKNEHRSDKWHDVVIYACLASGILAMVSWGAALQIAGWGWWTALALLVLAVVTAISWFLLVLLVNKLRGGEATEPDYGYGVKLRRATGDGTPKGSASKLPPRRANGTRGRARGQNGRRPRKGKRPGQARP